MEQPLSKSNSSLALRVLMVTGAYFPEISGAGLQCKSLISAATGDRLSFAVVTTSRDRTLPFRDRVDGVAVYRLPVSRLGALVTLACWLPRLAYILFKVLPVADIIHLHGLSRKSYFFIACGFLFRKTVLMKITSVGEDDPASIQRAGGLRKAFFRLAGFYICPSAALAESCRKSGIAQHRLLYLPNGVDCGRFRPVSREEKLNLRRELGLPEDGLIVLFAGHYSSDKRPHLLARAWSGIESRTVSLVFVGSSSGDSYEVSPEVVGAVNEVAALENLPGELIRVEWSGKMESYYQASDIFVLPSVREGMPNALLEAMATGLACAASRLEGITDRLFEGNCGKLFEPDDLEGLRSTIEQLAGDNAMREETGARARQKVCEEYGLEKVADLYRDFVFSI